MKDLVILNQAVGLQDLEGKYRKLCYLASPYAHKDQKIVEERFCGVSKFIIKNISGEHHKSVNYFSPVVETHTLIKQGLKMPPEGWYNYCLSFIINSKTKKPRIDELCVYMQDGWEKSVGIGIETAVARSHGIPIYYLNP